MNVAAGRGFVQSNNPFFPGQLLYGWQAPLYPLSLAGLYIFFGPHPIIGKLFGIAVGVATIYVTYDLARRIFPSSTNPENGRSRSVAFLSAFFVAVYPGFLTGAHLLLSETLFTFLLVLAFDLVAAAANYTPPLPPLNKGGTGGSCLRRTKGGLGVSLLVFAAGAAWGAATLTRGITLYFALPLILWLAVQWARRELLNSGKRLRKPPQLPVKSALTPVIAFAAGMILVVAPWTIRNLMVFHQIVLLETKGGVNFWLGNSPSTPNDFIRNVWKTGVREPMLAALPADEVARDRTGYALGESFIAREPWTFIARMPIKFADFWGFERNLIDAAEATRTGKPGGWNSLSKLAADLVSDVAYVVLVLLAVAGLVFSGGDRWKLLIGGFLLYYVFVHMVVFGDGRFHLPLIPFLAIYAAWLTVQVSRRGLDLSAQPVRILAGFALVLVFVGVWAHEIYAAFLALNGGS